MKHCWLIPSFALLLACLLGGCAELPKDLDPFEDWLQAPTAQVLGARVDAQSADAARILVTIQLTNPNDVDLPLKTAHYLLRTSGQSFSANENAHRVLPAKGMQIIELPAVVPASEALVGRDFSISGSVAYVPPGEVRRLITEYKVPLPSTHFSGQGRLAFAHEVPVPTTQVALPSESSSEADAPTD